MNDPRYEKLMSLVDKGREEVLRTLSSIKEEFAKRVDLIAKPKTIDYMVTEDIFPVINGNRYALTYYSRQQLLDRAGIPGTFVDRLLRIGEKELLRENLNVLTRHSMADGVLIRRVDDLIKGWLSPSYKRMDGSPIIESFLNAGIKYGFVPLRGSNTDYRYQIIMVYPQVFHPTENEYIAYGLALTTSDYGAKALDLSMIALRIVCTNLHIGYDMFRKVHLGSRFSSDREYIELSRKTIELDTKTIASAINDVTMFSINHFKEIDQLIKKANETEIDIGQKLDNLKKKGVRKEIYEKIKNAWEMPSDIEILPSSPSLWRFSNCISLIAQSSKSMDERIDLERMAMDVLIQ